ncbi:MAG: SUMF1/EgtB/PvdO family nonheme iron enzyme [Candidatus Aminicenantes bacterium]|nr:SUMF1/EgtB/PvdO family nonheme iron enzyme [Candidatus Aminicenantes bacterium]
MTNAMKDIEVLTPQVFISYSNKNETDRQVADKIYDTLKARDIPCWAAHRNIAGGQDWLDEIGKAISNSRVMIVVLSNFTEKSRYVRREVNQAAEENLIIIPFCTEKVSLTSGLRLLLNDCQWINAHLMGRDKALEQLVEDLHGYLGIEPGKSLKQEDKPLEVYTPSFQKKKVYNPNASLRRKRVLVAASIVIGVIAVVFFINQWTHNLGTTPLENKTGTVIPGDTSGGKIIITKPAEDEPKNTAANSAVDKQKKTVTEPAENSQTKTSSILITKKETAKLPDKNETDKKEKQEAPIKDQPDFISDLKSKGWDVKKNENDCWEAFYKAYDLTMIHIPPGKFMMGADEGYVDEKPLQEVDLDDYWIGKYEVTFAQYDRYCEATGKNKPGDEGWGRENRPVINVSWGDAAAYCRWLSQKTGLTFQLPTEAQWEKAGRGSRGFRYPWGNDFDKNKCNSDASGLNKTVQVGSYPSGKSPYGCMDMAGNVWEWCADWYDKDYYKNSPGKNPPGPLAGYYRVLRGGSWHFQSAYLRCAARNYDNPRTYWNLNGFRVARVCVPSHTRGE